MWVEALEPMTVRTKDGVQDVDPGTPFELSEEQARRLLEAAKGKVKAVNTRPSGWVDPKDQRFKDAFHAFSKWLDNVSPPLTKTRPRYDQVFEEFSHMDKAWLRGDLPRFREAIEAIRGVVEVYARHRENA